MKFGKLIGRAEELLPDLKHLCIRYKDLKKFLRHFRPDEHENDASPCSLGCRGPQAERQFLEMLHEDVRRLNDHFCEKEEEVVIIMQQLDEQTTTATTDHEKQLCHVGYIHLHGQLVLLFHWSMLNYTALIKILKKHDKVSGVVLKEPVLSNALKQPFSTTGMLSSLMAKCEQKARELESTTGGLDTLLRTFPQYECLFLIKETEAALDVWTDLRSNVSTPSTMLDPKLLSNLTSVGNGTKRKRAGAASSCTGDHVVAAGESPKLQRGEKAVERVERTDHEAATQGSMEEVCAAAVSVIAAMSVHVSRGDYEAHGGGELELEDAGDASSDAGERSDGTPPWKSGTDKPGPILHGPAERDSAGSVKSLADSHQAVPESGKGSDGNR